MKARMIFHGVAILVLLTTVAVAQTPVKPAKSAPAGQSANRESSAPSVSEITMSNKQTPERKSGSVIVLDREATTGQASGREASSGMATGRRQHEPVLLESDKSLGSAASSRETSSGMATGRRQYQPVVISNDKSSAHATESLAAPAQADTTEMQNASKNPMYKDNKSTGSNPLYESKDKLAAPGSSHDTVEYKDSEDMTTRYRPGNNKTSNSKPSTTNPQNK